MDFGRVPTASFAGTAVSVQRGADARLPLRAGRPVVRRPRRGAWHDAHIHADEPHGKASIDGGPTVSISADAHPLHSTPLAPGASEALLAAVPQWFHRIEVAPGLVTPGAYDPAPMLAQLPIPARLDGARALDIGAWDGFFSFALEQRGAAVVALEQNAAHTKGLRAIADAIGSGVEARVGNVYSLDPERDGTFDLVLFLGVLYHLRHPLLALDALWRVLADGALLVVESHVVDNHFVIGDDQATTLDDPDMSICQFYPGAELNRDDSNWWGPSRRCMAEMVRSSGFEVIHAGLWCPTRGVVAARRSGDPALLRLRDYDLVPALRESGVGEYDALATMVESAR